MPILKKIKEKFSKISLFFATILIMPIMVLLLIPVTAQSILILEKTSLYMFPGSTLYLLAYFITPIIYCIIASLLFHPKRLVSPMDVQIGVIVLFVSYSICIAFAKNIVTTLMLNSLIGQFLLMMIIALIVGYFQFLIVRWVIGLNFNSMDRASFIINENFNTVMKILDGDFIKSWTLSRRKDNPKSKRTTWILEFRDRDTKNNIVVLAIGEHQENKNKCILATTAYTKSSIGISESEIASARRDSIINDIIVKLKKTDSKLTLTPIKGVNDFVSLRAYDHALSATNSKIDIAKGFIWRIPLNYKMVIFITIISLIILTFACYFGYLSLDSYIGIAVIIIITIFFEIGLSLKEELFKKKIEELDE